ncbi:MAG TPA: glycosyltransferase family 2 protein, partial [Myxococcota bacterium]|nr:glycosyltransferase family 2 protein [Myxococcota bacterium]
MSLCLCTIVRNEERFLEGMLRSVQGVVDRIVVVDTGSTDRSVEIARKFGATVVFQPWQQDFSAPRNRAVEELSDGWVLVLDADERLAPGVGTVLRSVLTRQDIDVGLLPLHNARSLDASPATILSGEARQGAPVLLARLFRWHPTLRWEGVIHESPRSYLEGRPTARIEAPLLHYGYVEQLRAEKTAADRNLPLLQESCRRQPAEPLPFLYLGRELAMLGRPDEAAAALE